MLIKDSGFLAMFLSEINRYSKRGLYMNDIYYPSLIRQTEYIPRPYFYDLQHTKLEELLNNASLLFWPDDETAHWLNEKKIPYQGSEIYKSLDEDLEALGYDEEYIYGLYYKMRRTTPPIPEGSVMIAPHTFTHWYYEDPNSIFLIKENEWIVYLHEFANENISNALKRHLYEKVHTNEYCPKTILTNNQMYFLIDNTYKASETKQYLEDDFLFLTPEAHKNNWDFLIDFLKCVGAPFQLVGENKVLNSIYMPDKLYEWFITEEYDYLEENDLGVYVVIILGHNFKNEDFVRDGKYILYNGHESKIKRLSGQQIESKDILRENDIIITISDKVCKYFLIKPENNYTVIGSDWFILRTNEYKYVSNLLATKTVQEYFRNFIIENQNNKKAKIKISDLKKRFSDFPRSISALLNNEILEETSNEKLQKASDQLTADLQLQQSTLCQEMNDNIRAILSNTNVIIDKQILTNEKLDEALQRIKELSIDINHIKNNKREDEERISQIYHEIDTKLKGIALIDTKTFEYYRTEREKWLENFRQLDDLSHTFLDCAEFIFDKLPDDASTDFSPFIIQYCRVLENEILKKLFEAYHQFLTDNKVDRKKLVEDSMKELDKTKHFAKSILNNSLTGYTMGSMNIIMGYLKDGGKTLNGSILLQHFKQFTLMYFDKRVLEKAFINDVDIIVKAYRNKSAHPYLLSLNDAKNCQVILRKALNDLLSMYKSPIKDNSGN